MNILEGVTMLRERHDPDLLLLFVLGAQARAFYRDAHILSRICGVPVLRSEVVPGRPLVDVASVPARMSTIRQLVAAGQRVAVVRMLWPLEMLESPQEESGGGAAQGGSPTAPV